MSLKPKSKSNTRLKIHIFGVSNLRNFEQLPVTIVCCSIFAQVPESRGLFARVGGDDTTSPKFIGHAMRVLAGLDIAISLLDQPDALKAQLDHLHAQHVERHVDSKYWEVHITSAKVIWRRPHRIFISPRR